MPEPVHNRYTAYLSQALASRYGIVLDSDNPPLIVARLFKAKTTDPAFKQVSVIRTKLAPSSIFLVKAELFGKKNGAAS